MQNNDWININKSNNEKGVNNDNKAVEEDLDKFEFNEMKVNDFDEFIFNNTDPKKSNKNANSNVLNTEFKLKTSSDKNNFNFSQDFLFDEAINTNNQKTDTENNKMNLAMEIDKILSNN